MSEGNGNSFLSVLPCDDTHVNRGNSSTQNVRKRSFIYSFCYFSFSLFTGLIKRLPASGLLK